MLFLSAQSLLNEAAARAKKNALILFYAPLSKAYTPWIQQSNRFWLLYQQYFILSDIWVAGYEPHFTRNAPCDHSCLQRGVRRVANFFIKAPRSFR